MTAGYLFTVDYRKDKGAEWVRCQQAADTIQHAAELLSVKLDDIIYRTKLRLNGSTNAEVRGKKETPMSEGTAEAVKEMREKAANKKAGKPTAEAKKEKETTVKTSAKKKAVKKAAPKSGKRTAARKPEPKKVEVREGYLTDEKVTELAKAALAKDPEVSASYVMDNIVRPKGHFSWKRCKQIFASCGGKLTARCK